MPLSCPKNLPLHSWTSRFLDLYADNVLMHNTLCKKNLFWRSGGICSSFQYTFILDRELFEIVHYFSLVTKVADTQWQLATLSDARRNSEPVECRHWAEAEWHACGKSLFQLYESVFALILIHHFLPVSIPARMMYWWELTRRLVNTSTLWCNLNSWTRKQWRTEWVMFNSKYRVPQKLWVSISLFNIISVIFVVL
jgi:hypothetical protein